jgi:hypothetical protein
LPSSTRRGRGDAAGALNKDSGVVVAHGRTLKSSKGQWISLMHDGDSLYGVSRRGTGYTIQISVERESGTFASPKLQNDNRSHPRATRPFALIGIWGI